MQDRESHATLLITMKVSLHWYYYKRLCSKFHFHILKTEEATSVEGFNLERNCMLPEVAFKLSNRVVLPKCQP